MAFLSRPHAKTSLFCLILSLFFVTTYAQTESEIIAKMRKALKKSADDIHERPAVLKATCRMQKVSFDGVMYYHNPNHRFEFQVQGLTFIAFSNDTMAWDYNPMTEEHAVRKLNNEETKKRQVQTQRFDFATKDLLDYKKRNNKLKYLGKQRLDSIETHVLELTTAEKSKYKCYLDTRTHLMYKIEGTEGYQVSTNYKTFGDYVYPTFMSMNVSGQEVELQLTSVALDASIPDSLFRIPEEALNKKSKRVSKVDALITQGDSLYMKENYDGATEKYSQAIALDRSNASLYNARGLSKLYSEKYYESIADFSQAIDIQPDFANAMNNRGLAKYYLGDDKGALADYDKAIAVDSALSTAYQNRGLVYIRAEKYEEAARDFLKAINLDPEDAEAHYNYGVAIAQLEQYEDALLYYDKALQLNYRTAYLFNYRGVAQYHLEQYDSASASFKQALAMEPDELQYLENYGNALYEVGQIDLAIEQFEKYLKIRTDNAEIYNMIGLCKYKDEDYKGAISAFTKSIEVNGKNAMYFDNRAAAREEIEDYTGAIEDYSQSITLYPNDASVFYKRGLIKILTSKKIEGCLDLTTANEMKYEPAKEAIMQHCH